VLYYLPRLTRVEFLKLLTIQALVYGVIRVWLIFAYRENPGTMIVITWQNHVNQYLAYPPALFMTLGFLVLFAFIILRHWRQKHPFLRASSITLIIILILFFVAGMPIEFRVFLDVISVIALLVYSPARQAPDLGGA
jgi:glucan phosphoethanolaminetransferase (alkaline phosphatase superfamily)